MSVLPRLKSVSCLANDGRVVVILDPRTRVELADPTGQVLKLLHLLAEGTRDAAALAAELSTVDVQVGEDEIATALGELDRLGWLEDAAAPRPLSETERERHYSNLAFFDGFTSLTRSRESIQQQLRDAHVLVLGVGGLGSAVVQNLVGLGVGRLTLLDHDTVALRNFVRQFTYTPAQLGQPKVEQVAAWVREFDPTVEVTAVHQEVTGAASVAALLPGVDFVVMTIDTPNDVDRWVNQACVDAGIPFVRGGLAYLQGLYWSVDPGRSACRACLDTYRDRLAADEEVMSWPLVMERAMVNRGIGPVATILGGLMAMEALRYLTGIAAPVAAGTYHLVDFTGDCRISTDPWPREPGCPACGVGEAA